MTCFVINSDTNTYGRLLACVASPYAKSRSEMMPSIETTIVAHDHCTDPFSSETLSGHES